MTATKKTKGALDGEAEAPSRSQMEALARMIEYARAEAKEGGLFLTAHLLGLAGWSVQEAQANAEALQRQRTRGPREAQLGTARAVDSETVN